MLTNEQLKFYQDNGYLLVKDVITNEQLNKLQEITYEFIDISRTICRKAERLCVKVKDKDLLNNDLNLILLNRLSDLLFILARYIDKEKEYIKASE